MGSVGRGGPILMRQTKISRFTRRCPPNIRWRVLHGRHREPPGEQWPEPGAVGKLTSQPSQRLLKLPVARVGVKDRRQRAHMPREPLRQEQVVGHTVHICHRRVAQRNETP